MFPSRIRLVGQNSFLSQSNLFCVNFQKCWPYTHPTVIDNKTESPKHMMSSYCMRVDENMRERVREDNNNVDMWFRGEERGKKGSDILDESEGF